MHFTSICSCMHTCVHNVYMYIMLCTYLTKYQTTVTCTGNWYATCIDVIALSVMYQEFSSYPRCLQNVLILWQFIAWNFSVQTSSKVLNCTVIQILQYTVTTVIQVLHCTLIKVVLCALHCTFIVHWFKYCIVIHPSDTWCIHWSTTLCIHSNTSILLSFHSSTTFYIHASTTLYIHFTYYSVQSFRYYSVQLFKYHIVISVKYYSVHSHCKKCCIGFVNKFCSTTLQKLLCGWPERTKLLNVCLAFVSDILIKPYFSR